MSADRCDQEIFEKGQSVTALDAGPDEANAWVEAVATKANARMDWHYSGGRAHVLHLGDAESRARVEEVIDQLAPDPNVRILQRYKPGDRGLYRQGVTPTPPNAIAFDPHLDAFFVKP